MRVARWIIVACICFWGFDGVAQHRNRAAPDFAVVQHAGSIGYFSAGLGYDILKSNARFSTHFGFVPPAQGGRLQIVAAKLLFKPVTLSLHDRLHLNPCDIGLMGSFHYGSNFETRWPDGVHPKGYYWWHPALRVHLALETSLLWELPKDHNFRALAVYAEFNTNDLYFISFIQNTKTVNPADIIKAGIGIRVYF